MRLRAEIRDCVCILEPQGRFVTGSDTDLRAARKYLEENGISKAVIDFGGVPYIDSTGLGFVVELHKSLASRGGQLLLANANERIREVLQLTRIAEIVPLFDDTSEAEAALQGEVLC
jgi:anti-anti-sigma factor